MHVNRPITSQYVHVPSWQQPPASDRNPRQGILAACGGRKPKKQVAACPTKLTQLASCGRYAVRLVTVKESAVACCAAYECSRAAVTSAGVSSAVPPTITCGPSPSARPASFSAAATSCSSCAATPPTTNSSTIALSDGLGLACEPSVQPTHPCSGRALHCSGVTRTCARWSFHISATLGTLIELPAQAAVTLFTSATLPTTFASLDCPQFQFPHHFHADAS